MEVSYNPNLELRLNSMDDFELVLYWTLDYARDRLDRRTRKQLSAISRELLKVTCASYYSKSDDLHIQTDHSKLTHVLSGDKAQLAVRSIDMYVEGTINDLNAAPLELRMAGYGMKVLEQVQDDTDA